jgi:lysophospholipase L1-like esterase
MLGWVAGALAGWGGGVSYAQPYHLNLEASYGAFREAAGSGSGIGSIVCIGDSLTFRDGGFHEVFKQLVQNSYGDAGWGYQGMSPWTGASGFESANWLQGRINSDTQPFRGLDGLWMSAYPWARTSAWLALVDPIVRVHYAVEPTAGSITVRLPWEEVLTLDATGPNQLGLLDVEFAPEQERTVRFFSHADGWATILGAENLNGQAGALVHRVANGGWGVENYLFRDWTFDAQIAQLRPELIIIMLGQNDPEFEYNGFRQRMGQLIDRLALAWPAGKVVLVSSYDSGSPHLIPHADALRDLAAARGVGFIDLYRAGGAYQFYLNAGLLDPDGVHFSSAGGAHVANLVFDALESGGVSLANAPCGDIDFNNNGSVFDTEDVDAFLSVFSEGPCLPMGRTCDPIDFNRDGSQFDTDDIDAFLRVFSEGPCGA